MGILDESFLDKAQLKQIAEIRGEPSPFFKLQREELDIEAKTLKITAKCVGGGFVLGHPLWGKLGVSRLGKYEMDLGTIRIVNPRNTFEDDFYDTSFLISYPSYCRYKKMIQFI